MIQIGITERGDAAVHVTWYKGWVGIGRPAILITKDPECLTRILNILSWPERVIVHCTITGLGKTWLEPGVPHPESALLGYRRIRDKIGGQRTVLRVDPIVPYDNGWLEIALRVIRAAGLTTESRLRISFLDNYPHVKERFLRAKQAVLPYDFHAPLDLRKEALAKIQQESPCPVEICAEPGLDCTGCISQRDLMALGLTLPLVNGEGQQRKFCRCAANKRELLTMSKPCRGSCVYCYWKE